jgi:holliday junction DNA helicase RuvA
VISSLRGTVLSRTGADIVIEVTGIGYKVTVPDRLALAVKVGEEILVHTAFIVRDDLVALFGFDSTDELFMFDLLRGVTGVGPKSAMAILGQLSADDIYDAVVKENDAVFRSVSGIGPKTAKLLVLSLSGALDQVPKRLASTPHQRAEESVKQSVVQALVGLGWSDKVAKSGVAEALESHSGEAVDANTLLRQALTILGPQTNREGGS